MDDIKKAIEEAERDKSHDLHYIFDKPKLFDLLKMVAKDAYHIGFINKTPHTNFTWYWQQTLKKLKE